MIIINLFGDDINEDKNTIDAAEEAKIERIEQLQVLYEIEKQKSTELQVVLVKNKL